MINVNDYLLPEDAKPDWLVYPTELIELVQSGRVKLTPWHLSKSEVDVRHAADLKSRLGRDLVPFAYRQDREDLACFEKGKGQAVMIIHDNTEPGWEDEGSYPSFADWLRAVEEEAASWIPVQPSQSADGPTSTFPPAPQRRCPLAQCAPGG